MDTSDRPDSMLPARSHSPSFGTPARGGPAYNGGGGRELAAAGSTMQVDPNSILRGLLRSWWKILGLWLILSAPVVYTIYSLVKPTFEAVSRVLVEPTPHELFQTASNYSAPAIERSIRTELQTITTDQVLETAVADPSLEGMPILRESQSPKAEVFKRLKVTNPRDTNYIEVSMESTSPTEAAAVVNAVVQSYLNGQAIHSTGQDRILTDKIEAYLKNLKDERQKKIDELALLVDEGNVSLPGVGSKKADTEKASEPSSPAGTFEISLEQLRKYKDRLLETQVKLFEARLLLDRRLADFQDQGAVEDVGAAAGPSEEEIAERVNLEFLADPAIADLRDEIRDVQRRLEHVEKSTRKGNDPSRMAHKSRLDELKKQHDDLWAQNYAPIRARILAALDDPAAPPTPGEPGRPGAVMSVPELRDEIRKLEVEEGALTKVLGSAELETKTTNSQTYRAQVIQTEIDSLTDNLRLVTRRLEELKFRNDRSLVRVSLKDAATVPKMPSSSKRIKLMAAAPLGILALVLGIFSLLEVRAERVGDPDSLSTRVQSEVYALPPLPASRSRRQLASPGDDDQIDRFIQRLDHLRFAVCGDHAEVGLGRCVLISSAVGGEGKTTLAAQLAARCGHAGHATLLIDADLRRGSLSPLLDVPDGMGLRDILTREDLNVEDLAVPVQGGTFHLLTAGTPTSDTARIFQGRAFGMLVARLRQLYDLIIIDTPPILPVPDALIMGRWTDGVVLTSRYDVSRAPQVERARRQLDLAGIPVLGTVINGMRTSDSYYGRYSYSRSGSESGERERPADAPTG